MSQERRRLDKAGMGISEGLPLEISDDSPAALRRGLQTLMDIEAVKQKAGKD